MVMFGNREQWEQKHFGQKKHNKFNLEVVEHGDKG